MLAHNSLYPYTHGMDIECYTTVMRNPSGSFSLGDPFQKTFDYFNDLKSFMREHGWDLAESVTPEKIEYLKLNWLWRSPSGKAVIADSIPYLYSVPSPCMTL